MNRNRLPKLTYYEPKTIVEVLELKNNLKEDAVLLAGGTDVIPLLKRRNIAARQVINIKHIPELRQMSLNDRGELEIGAAVTLRDVMDSRLVAETCPLLRKAVAAVASNQIRNMATLVGNVCLDNKCGFFNQTQFWWQSRQDCFKRGGDRCYVVKEGKQCHALSSGDSVSALIALEAELIIAAPDGGRRLSIETFYTGDGQRPHQLSADEFVTAVRIPPSANEWRVGFIKKSIRGSVDFAIAALSMRLRKSGTATEEARIALNGISTRPIRARRAETVLIEKGINAESVNEVTRLVLEEARPLSLIGVPILVRRQMIAAMVEDLVAELVK